MTQFDLDRVMAIETRVYPFPWSRGNFSDSLKSGYDAWVCEATGDAGPAMVGYAILMWTPDEVHLLNLSIGADWQGRGHGRALLDWLCRDCRARGARAMLLEVRPSNLPAVTLYQERGFERIGLRRGYYPADGGLREDALVLRKVLSDE